MNSTYAQKSSTVQKAADAKAASVLDSSAQSESLQRKADMANNAIQRAEAPRPNNTGMPDNLKSGIESLSGFSMDNVRVHYNSSKPATVQALAYTQGTDIHVAPGQEKHLPHEAWHVAQQMAGRVSPTTNINGMPVNDNAALEHEADVMGEKAVMQRMEKKLAPKKNEVNYNIMQKKIFLNYKEKDKKNKEKKIENTEIDTVQGLFSYLFCDSKYGFEIKYNKNGIYLPLVDKEIDELKRWYVKECDVEIPENVYDESGKRRELTYNDILELTKKFTIENFKNIYEQSFSNLKELVVNNDCLTEIGKSAYSECHLGYKCEKTPLKDKKAAESPTGKFLAFVKQDSLYKKYVDLKLKDPMDLSHQIAQDYILANGDNFSYKELVGIRHQFSDYSYDKREKIENDLSCQNVRIYRSMPLTEFLKGTLHGHGGPLGMALKYDFDDTNKKGRGKKNEATEYDNAAGRVIVEISFGNAISVNKEVGDGEGSKTSSSSLGRKMESQSCLPQSSMNAGLNEKNEIGKFSTSVDKDSLFSFNFSNVDEFFKGRNDVYVRVVYVSKDSDRRNEARKRQQVLQFIWDKKKTKVINACKRKNYMEIKSFLDDLGKKICIKEVSLVKSFEAECKDVWPEEKWSLTLEEFEEKEKVTEHMLVAFESVFNKLSCENIMEVIQHLGFSYDKWPGSSEK